MQSKSIKIGEYNKLIFSRQTQNGIYLKAQDDSEVLLPNTYVSDDLNLDNEIDVFIYTDSEDRVVATTQKPKAVVGEFAFLKVIDKNKDGYFLDWGLSKDLFVPKTEQKGIKLGEKYLFFIALDEMTNRVYASQKIGKYFKNKIDLKKSQEVDILIFAKTPLGFKAVIENSYSGMLYHNEIFENIQIGDIKKAYIKNIRKDLKIDLSLKKIGKRAKDDDIKRVLDILKELGGSSDLNYKSDPDIIKKKFKLSKKAFKRALTKMLEDRLISIDEKGIKLL